jgi:hypothetical protein
MDQPINDHKLCILPNENSSCYEKFTIKEEKKEIHRTNSKFIDLIIIYLQIPTAIRIPT